MFSLYRQLLIVGVVIGLLYGFQLNAHRKSAAMPGPGVGRMAGVAAQAPGAESEVPRPEFRQIRVLDDRAFLYG